MAESPQAEASSHLFRSNSSLTVGSNGYAPSHASNSDAASDHSPLLGSRSSSSSSSTLQNILPDMDDNAVAAHRVTPARAACICASMWLLIFMQASNMSGMPMIQGYIADDLDAHDKVLWFTSAYLIAIGSTSPLAGRLATTFSLRHMMLGAACLFAAGVTVSSRAGSFAVFILGRILTGMSGGCIMALGLITVLQLTSTKDRGLFMGLANAGITFGVSAGAVVFAALLPVLGWREIFLVQAPVCLVAGVGAYLSIPSLSTTEPSKHKSTLQKLKTIDYTGAITLTTAIVLFLYGFSGTIQPLPMVLSALVLALFVFNEYKWASDPIIPISVLQSRGVLLSCLAQLGLMAARWTVLFYAPVFVLAVRGLPPTVAGTILIPTNVGFAIGGVVVGWIHIRRAGDFWLPSLVSIFLFALAMVGLSLTSNSTSPIWLYVVVVFCNGFCTGAALNYALAHMLHVSTPSTHYISASLLGTFRGFSGSFGTAIGGGIFTRKLRDALTLGFKKLDGADGLSPGRESLVSRLVGSPNLVFDGQLSDVERAVAVDGYEVALKKMYVAAAVLTVFVLFIQASTGWTEPAYQEVAQEIPEGIDEHDGRGEA